MDESRYDRYNRVNSVHIGIKLNRTTDAAILAMLDTVPSKQGYIREILMEDIRKNRPELLTLERYEK